MGFPEHVCVLLGVPTVTAMEHNNLALPGEAEEGCAPDPAFHLVAQRCSCCVPKDVHTSFVMAKPEMALRMGNGCIMGRSSANV